MKVITKRSWGEHTERLVSTKYYCPHCGVKKVVSTDDGGDYYVGESLYCLSCKYQFNIPDIGLMDENKRIEK